MVGELSIIIPTLNEEKYLPKLLDSIAMQNFRGKLQIIVVDGSSTDQTIQIAQDYKDKLDLLILRTPADIGLQKNKGVEKAKYESLLFIDADMILPKNVLNKFTKNIDPKEKSIQNIFFLPTREGPIHHYMWFFTVHLLLAISLLIKPVIFSGGFMFTTKTNHKEIDGFKEGAIAAEDIDYGERSIKNGAKFRFHFDCFVYNSTRRAQLMGLLPMNWFYLRGLLYYGMHGVLCDKKKFNYPYGQYDIIEESIKPSPAPVPATL